MGAAPYIYVAGLWILKMVSYAFISPTFIRSTYYIARLILIVIAEYRIDTIHVPSGPCKGKETQITIKRRWNTKPELKFQVSTFDLNFLTQLIYSEDSVLRLMRMDITMLT